MGGWDGERPLLWGGVHLAKGALVPAAPVGNLYGFVRNDVTGADLWVRPKTYCLISGHITRSVYLAWLRYTTPDNSSWKIKI
jgi:hypothetical protein